MIKSLRIGDVARRALLGLTLFAGFLLLAGVTCDQERAEAVDRLNEGLEDLDQGRTLDAVEKLKEANEADADFPKSRYQLGQIYEIKLNDPEKAERYYRAALEIDAENIDYKYALGRVLASTGHHEEALKYLQTVVDEEGDHAPGWYRLGGSQEAMGDKRSAIDSYMNSIEADPRMTLGADDPGGAAYHALGNLYVRYEYYDKALKVYENGTTNNPESARLYLGRGVAQLEMERYSDAARSFEKALDNNKRYAPALFNLGVAHEAMGNKPEALEALKRFTGVADRGNKARLSAARGMIQRLQGEMDDE